MQVEKSNGKGVLKKYFTKAGATADKVGSLYTERVEKQTGPPTSSWFSDTDDPASQRQVNSSAPRHLFLSVHDKSQKHGINCVSDEFTVKGRKPENYKNSSKMPTKQSQH